MTEQNTGDEMIQVKRVDFDKLIETTTRQANDIETLYKVADKSALARVRQAQTQGNLIRTAKAWFWPKNGQFIVATKLIKNVGEIVAGRYYEDQVLQVVFEDGSIEETSYLNFHRTRTFVVGEIVSRSTTTNSSGEEEGALKLQFGDGKTIQVSEKFIN